MKPSVAHFFGFALGSTLCLLTAVGVQAADKPKAAAPASTNAAPAEAAAPVEEKTIILVKAVFENPLPGSKLIDPFFPGSQRPPYKPLETAKKDEPPQPTGTTPVDCYEGITLKGVSSFAGGRLLAIINQTSMEKGEIANVKTTRGNVVRIEIVDLKAASANAPASAIIRAIETKQGNEIIDLRQQCNPKEIFLQQQ